MKKINKVVILLCAVMVMLLSLGQVCFAAELPASLTVELKDAREENIDKLKVDLCQVAVLSGAEYVLSDDFKQSGITVDALLQSPTEKNAQSLADYIVNNKLTVQTAESAEGKAIFPALEFGIYVVFCEEAQSHYFKPFFVFLPQVNNDQFVCDAVSIPKVVENTENDKSIYVLKKWADNEDVAKKRPDKITVDLKQDGKTVATAELTEDTGWAYTFTGLKESGKYSVEEKNVEYYKAEYNGDSENGFIITNVYVGEKLAQTGQYWWPIVFLIIAGCALVLLGAIELRGKHHESKKH